MTLLAALDDLETLLKSDEKFIAWLAKYDCHNGKAVTFLKTNREVVNIPQRYLPCIILELPDGDFGAKGMGGVQQEFAHQIDLVFGIQVGHNKYEDAFNARVELIDEVLPSFFLSHDRLGSYVNDAKLQKFSTDSGVHFPKVFLQATILLTGYAKRG